MNAKNLKSILVKFLFAILMFALVVFLMNYMKEKKDLARLEDQSSIPPTLVSVSEDFKDDALSDFNRLLSLETFEEYWDNWVFGEDLARFQVMDVDKEGRTLSLYVEMPDIGVIGNQYISVNSTCKNSQTILMSTKDPLKNVKDKDFDLFSIVKKTDILYSYCKDEECLNIGDACILLN